MVLGIALAITSRTVAQTADDDRARGHFEAARSYYDQARYEEAAREFEEAYGLSERPALLLNASNAHERAGNLEGAIGALERYLTHDVADRRTIENRLEQLRGRHAQQAAQVEPAAEPAPQELVAAAPGPSGGGGLGELGIVGLTVGGAGIAAAIVAIATGVVAEETYADLQSRCPGDVCPPDARADVDSGRALAWTSTILLPLSIVMVAAGVTLFTIDLTDDGGGAEQVRLSPGPGLAGLSLEVSFR